MKTRVRLLAATASLTLASMYFAPAPVLAEVPAKTAWWTQGQQSAFFGNQQIPYNQSPNAADFHISNAGCPGQSMGCADLPDNPAGTYPVGFGPTAISAVAYNLPSGGLPAGTEGGTVIAELKLTVDGPPVASNFTILACKVLDHSWAPVNGGDWAARPGYQQGGCGVGVPSADGTTVGFTIVAALASRTTLDLALVPKFGDPTPFQELFTSNDPKAITWKPVPPAVNRGAYQPAQQPVATSAGAPFASSYTAPLIGPIPPAAPESAAAAPAQGAPSVGLPIGRIGPSQNAVTVQDQRLILLLLAVILALFAAQWTAPVRRLLSFERAAVRGVGRFVRPRTELARPL